MYVTRPLSEYRKNPSELKKPPPEGPNSGVLVIQDEESLTTCCFGLCYEVFLRGLPFPQNAALTVRRDDGGQNNTVHRDPAVFIPVLGLPLSSNRYYTYERCGHYSRESSTSDEKEVERVTCCFCIRFNHVHMYKKPQPDPYDIHRQVVITTTSSPSRSYYHAKPIAPNALLPAFLMRQGWTIENSTSTLQDFGLIDDAKGLNVELRSKLPGLDMSAVVGKWYVPFLFVKEGDIIDQVKRSMYYNMTLHQRWEEVFYYENVHNEDCVDVVVDVDIEVEVINVEGQKVDIETTRVDAKGIVWFQVLDQEGKDKKIGLRSMIVERIHSDEESFGWKKIDGNQVKGVDAYCLESCEFRLSRVIEALSVDRIFMIQSSVMIQRGKDFVYTILETLEEVTLGYGQDHCGDWKYQRKPSELTQPPPDGPSSGILVIHDQAPILTTRCFGSYVVVDSSVSGLPFPQNFKLAVSFNSGGDDSTRDPIVFIPVLDKPLSSNCYYAIRRRGKHSGEASASAKEEDLVSWCCCITQVREAKPRQLDPYDTYQQFEIHQKKPSSRYYHATSVAPDGVPPMFLKKKEWSVEYSRSQEFELRDDAKGLNTELRSELPALGTRIVVGKWYVPFVFVKERDPKDQIKTSMYYSMTLEQRWEEVFSCENDKSEDFDVVVDVEVKDEAVKLEGQEMGRGVDANGFVWFGVGDKKVGLGSLVVERMKWVEERFGWTGKGDQKMAVKRLEKPKDGSFWKSYHCYVLIESFVLKRRDESLVITYEFRHVDKVKNKWD
ncbi:unnamed protein product [Thlaspi arvense]|uniref:Uncharacterized protein n=1 Tax=Thlaspi arvense TaxID=13288 RepID=A0AAU9RC79_THLAR|nr:unnamed protein product [Thlaspi arvense]